MGKRDNHSARLKAKDKVSLTVECPTCKSSIGRPCTKRLITGQVCRWDRRVSVIYFHARRKKAAKENENG
jgi:hypothetical protein